MSPHRPHDKVLIGADNLTANGIELPDVAGAVVSGTASGDWTLSCVRGQVRSITFVFHDGTIRFTDALVRIFSTDFLPMRHGRGAGLFALDLIPPLRNFVARRMMFGARAWP